MAIVPQYGRKVAAPGPVPWGAGAGPLYNQGLTALAEVSGDVAGVLADKAERIRRASEAATVIGRSAQYSLDMAAALQVPTNGMT